MNGRLGNERGVALVIVLGLVALIAAWAAEGAYEDMIAMRRAENFQQLVRATMANESALALAVQVLGKDAATSQRDDLAEPWAQSAPPLPLDEGTVEGHIEDGNRYFDLNQLLREGKPDPDAMHMLQQVFARNGFDPGKVEALVDWLDRDDTPIGPGGAEDAAYYDRSYHVANAPMRRWNTLRKVRGFDDPRLLRWLRRVCTVVPPTGKPVKVNVNTAPEAVLRMLFPRMSKADAEALIAGRPYDSVASAVAGKAWADAAGTQRLSVHSDVFIVYTKAVFGRVSLRERFVLYRDQKGIRLLLRERII